MCAGCVFTAAAGASGARAWLQTRVSRRALKALTVVLFVAALGASSVSISGSSPPPRAGAAQASAAR
jgi:hypothetical protein